MLILSTFSNLLAYIDELKPNSYGLKGKFSFHGSLRWICDKWFLIISLTSSQKHFYHLLHFEFLSAFKHTETETFHNTCKSSLSAKDKMPSKIMTLAP